MLGGELLGRCFSARKDGLELEVLAGLNGWLDVVRVWLGWG